MVFSSTVFLFAYLPLVLLGYYLLGRRAQIYYLFALNLVFYGWGEPVYVLLMVFSIAMNYAFALAIVRWPKHKKLFLIFCVAINLGILGYYKYTNFFMDNLSAVIPALRSVSIPDVILPIGISFYTFQCMSYVIDVYRGDVDAQKNPFLFGTYVALFPQLIAGPIVRYSDVNKELIHRTITVSDIDAGLKRFIVGMGKKLLLANAMGQLWEQLAASPAQNGIAGSWVGIIAYTFQIYFDFSGYSDMAIGLGRMLGFHFLENFNYPYIAQSITDFWRRWHISLSSWFREYVYIPLGGNRRGLPRQLINISIVWLLTGLWHGASWNFVLWGLYFAVLLILEKTFLLNLLKKAPRFLRHLYALTFIVLGWALFYFTDAASLFAFLKTLFTGTQAFGADALRLFAAYLPTMALCVLASTPLCASLWKKLPQRARDFLEPVGALALMIWCVAAITGQSDNPFIYFRF
jgi:alginate O-acetyltransferase complex protein AlgI